MGYKLIAIDLDGTLLTDNKEFTEGNREAITRALDAGLRVVIASGRPHLTLARFNKMAGLDYEGSVGMAFNGSVVYDAHTMEVLSEHRLSPEDCLAVYRAVTETDPDAPLILYTDNLMYYEHEDVQKYNSNANVNFIRVPSMPEQFSRGAVKLQIRWTQEDVLRIYHGVKDRLAGVCEITFTGEGLLEFLLLGMSKSTGLSFLTDYVGISMQDVVAIGDSHNDMEMVRDAGLGIAVRNAVDVVKDAAQLILTANNNEDAIKEAVDYILSQP